MPTTKPERWIVIPNWERFQHYKNRNPIWIKAYPELLSDQAYLDLTFHQRGVLHGLWMEYARSNRQIRDSTLTATRRLGDRVSRATLDALNHAGFIHYSASKPLSQSREREEKNTRAVSPTYDSPVDNPTPNGTGSLTILKEIR